MVSSIRSDRVSAARVVNGRGTTLELSRVADVALHEKVLVVGAFVVILFSTFDELLPGGAETRTGGSRVFQILSGSIYFAGLSILFYRGVPKWLFEVLWRAAPLILLLLLTLLSAAWSLDPEVTVRRAVALLMSSSFAIYLVARFDLRTLLSLLVVSFLVFEVTGVAAVLEGTGVFRLPPYAGAWQGFTGQKNEFARTIALAVALVPAAVLLGVTDWKRTAILTSVVALGMLFLAKSATSLAAAFASVIVGPVLFVILGGAVLGIRLQIELRMILALTVIATLVFIAVWGQQMVLDLLGRDPTLTGRTKLWQWALSRNEDRIWLGYGYRAFWIDDNTRYFFEFFPSWDKDPSGELSDSYAGPTHSHSGYIDTLLELGIVGLTMLGVTVAGGLVQLRSALGSGNNGVGLLFAILTAFLLIYSYTAKSFLQHSEDLWFLFTVLYFFLIKESLGAELAPKRSTWQLLVKRTRLPAVARQNTSGRL